MAIAANDAADRVDQLIILTERLTELITGQCQAFEERRPQDAAGLLEETSRLANLYRHESVRIRADTRLVEAAPLAARTVTEGLVKCIADEVAAQRTKAVSYGATGTQTARTMATAITLNRRA